MYKDVNIYMTYFDKVEIFQCVSSKSGNIWHRIYAHVHFDKSSMQILGGPSAILQIYTPINKT